MAENGERYRPGRWWPCAKSREKLCRTTGALGITPCHNAEEVVTRADVVILAVKPYQLRR